MTKYRQLLMEREGITSDFFYAECQDAGREWLLRYFKNRQEKAIESGTYCASIRTLTALDLEYLIDALSATEPATYIGNVEKEMRKVDD